MRRLGFTLVEVLVAVGITLLLAGSLFGFVFDLQQRQGAVLSELARTREATAIFNAIERAARTSTAHGSNGSVGFQGSREELLMTYRVTGVDQASVMEVRVLNDEQGVILSEGGGGDLVDTSFAKELSRVDFSYFSDGQWNESHAEGEGILPRAIRVKLWYANEVDLEGERAEVDSSIRGGSDREQVRPDRVRVIALPGAKL